MLIIFPLFKVKEDTFFSVQKKQQRIIIMKKSDLYQKSNN